MCRSSATADFLPLPLLARGGLGRLDRRRASRQNVRKLMSTLPPKADMCGATSDVRFGPEADTCTAADVE
jgi:hypothetical protein